jgi:hypothetical protein
MLLGMKFRIAFRNSYHGSHIDLTAVTKIQTGLVFSISSAVEIQLYIYVCGRYYIMGIMTSELD